MKFLESFWNVVKSQSAMAVLAVVGFGFAIYQTFFYEKKGEIVISVDALSRVFDIYQPVGGLDISYGGENLRSAKKALWVMSFSVRNSGNAEIKKGDYDEQVPFGLKVVGATIVDTPSLKTTNDYLTKNLKLNIDKDQVILSPVIFEPNDYAQISILLLGPDSGKPSITAFGKIAGIKHISVVTPDTQKTDKSMWQTIVQADTWWAHPARFFIYGIGGVLTIGILGALAAALATPIQRIKQRRVFEKRRSHVSLYRPNEDLNREVRVLIDLYISLGDDILLQTSKVINLLKKKISLIERLSDKVDDQTLEDIANKTVLINHNDQWLINDLRRSNVIVFDGIRPKFSDTFESSLKDFCAFLKIDLSLPDENERRRKIENEDFDLFVSETEPHTLKRPC